MCNRSVGWQGFAIFVCVSLSVLLLLLLSVFEAAELVI